MNIEKRINAFVLLGDILRNPEKRKEIMLAIDKSKHENLWFTNENTINAILSIGKSLKEENIRKWLQAYSNLDKTPKKIAIVMAGNIPMVGFHDFLSVLISGNKVVAKLSSNDQYLLPAVGKILVDIEPLFQSYIEFTTGRIADFDAIIATGSNNTARYFEYYFGKYPNIIRKNRNSIAILNGNETHEELSCLADDVFLYFGLGCRSVSKLFIPKEYNFAALGNAFQKYSLLSDLNKYLNNYTYQKTICLMNNIPFIDGGFFILREEQSLQSPLSVLNYEYYTDIKDVASLIHLDNDKLQCVVSNISEIQDKVAIGTSQLPNLWDYADNVDTLQFLFNIS